MAILIGSSPTPLEEAAPHLDDLRVAEVELLDMSVGTGTQQNSNDGGNSQTFCEDWEDVAKNVLQQAAGHLEDLLAKLDIPPFDEWLAIQVEEPEIVGSGDVVLGLGFEDEPGVVPGFEDGVVPQYYYVDESTLIYWAEYPSWFIWLPDA